MSSAISGPEGICPICRAERRKQTRRRTVRPNRILAEHPDHPRSARIRYGLAREKVIRGRGA